MDTEAFVAWALDDARTVDERFAVEMLAEQGVQHWNIQRKVFTERFHEERSARQRERKLNPAYEPFYTEEDLRKTAEALGEMQNWWPRGDRALTSLEVVRFFPSLEWVWLNGCAAVDLSPLAALPRLRKLAGIFLGNVEDFTFLPRCGALRELSLSFGAEWPDLSGLGALDQLDLLELTGNLLTLPQGIAFPKVRRAVFACIPLPARRVADLPGLPACEILTLSGIQRLAGIEKMPRLRNLTIASAFDSYEPLTTLSRLTCLTVRSARAGDNEKQPADLSPLARVPELRYFNTGGDFGSLNLPRDYSPLAEAPALRELIVQNCPPVVMEVAAIQAGLPPWDDVFLRPEPRPLPPLRMVLAPFAQTPARHEEQPDPGETGCIDTGLRDCEGRWVQSFAHSFIADTLGHPDWGTVTASGLHRSLGLTVESFDVVERLPEIVEAARAVIARLRPDYIASFGVHLKVPPPKLTAAQQAIEDKWQDEMDEMDFEQQRRDRLEYLERMHELELKKQQGLEINPDDFSPPEPGAEKKVTAGPGGEGETGDDADFEIDPNDEDGEGEGDIAIATEEDPEVNFLNEDEHPLAANYMCAGAITLEEVWFYAHFRGIACHLMGRQPDREIAEEKKAGE